LSQTATFNVVAQGPGALSYQWSRNGALIQGATEASYSTAPVELADSGASFTVTVRAGGDSVTSVAAVLTVGPRSPASGDLRFQEVDSKASADIYAGAEFHYLEYPFGWTYQNEYGSPLRLGVNICVAGVPQDCAWYYSVTPVTSDLGLTAGYIPDVFENLDSDLNSRTNANSVVTSLDIESGEDVFGMAWTQGPTPGFDYKHEIVSMSDLSALVANDGANSRVVTAISIDGNGQIHLLSYGWASDTTTVYDTSVATASYDGIPAQAIALANAGYIITAFGGNPTDGYILVGTKVHGDTLPRPILTFPPSDTSVSVSGYALVGQVFGQEAGDVTWIFEK
jgi:hypothetical protein